MTALPAAVVAPPNPPRAPEPTQPPQRSRRATYPAEDGKLLAETQVHLDQIMYLLAVLDQFFAAAPDVFVAADLLLYYVKGDPKKRVAPDIFVARGVRDAKAKRRTYLLWEEGVPPSVVFEITSRKTRREDTGKKRDLYRQLGVREYFLFDPLGDYLHPPLQGFSLVGSDYEPMAPAANDSLQSEVLGLEVHRHGQNIRLWDPQAQRRLSSYDELAAEVARLRALLDQQSRDG